MVRLCYYQAAKKTESERLTSLPETVLVKSRVCCFENINTNLNCFFFIFFRIKIKTGYILCSRYENLFCQHSNHPQSRKSVYLSDTFANITISINGIRFTPYIRFTHFTRCFNYAIEHSILKHRQNHHFFRFLHVNIDNLLFYKVVESKPQPYGVKYILINLY